jgi:hypothetical protein
VSCEFLFWIFVVCLCAVVAILQLLVEKFDDFCIELDYHGFLPMAGIRCCHQENDFIHADGCASLCRHNCNQWFFTSR